MVTCSVLTRSCDGYALVSATPAAPSPRLLYVYAQAAEGTRRANSATLIAQHMDAAKVMSTTRGDAITQGDPTTPWANPRAS